MRAVDPRTARCRTDQRDALALCRGGEAGQSRTAHAGRQDAATEAANFRAPDEAADQSVVRSCARLRVSVRRGIPSPPCKRSVTDRWNYRDQRGLGKPPNARKYAGRAYGGPYPTKSPLSQGMTATEPARLLLVVVLMLVHVHRSIVRPRQHVAAAGRVAQYSQARQVSVE